MANKKNEYFGGGPFSGEFDDLAQSVKRIADKKAKGFMAGWTQEQVTDVSEPMANKSVQDAYVSKIVNPALEPEEDK